jgi:hypothetical protein
VHQLAERKPDQERLETQDVHRKQRLVAAAEVRHRHQSGHDRQRRNEPGEVVIEIGQHAKHGMQHTAEDRGDQRRERNRRRHVDHDVGQRGPRQAREALDEQDMRGAAKHDDCQPDVERVGDDRAVARALAKWLVVHETGEDRAYSAGFLAALARFRQVGLAHRQVKVQQAPDKSRREHGNGNLQAPSACKFEQLHHCIPLI